MDVVINSPTVWLLSLGIWRCLYPWDLLVKTWRHDEGITPEDEERVRAFLEAEGRLVTKEDGTLWVKCWYRDAVIYAEKE